MLPKTGNELHRPSNTDGKHVDFRDALAVTLKTELGTTHQAIKTVMAWTGASERTSKHWFAGTHEPSASHLIALVHHSDEVLAAFLEAADRPGLRVQLQLVGMRAKLLDLVALIDGAAD
jgi:hypothetical protein